MQKHVQQRKKVIQDHLPLKKHKKVVETKKKLCHLTCLKIIPGYLLMKCYILS